MKKSVLCSVVMSLLLGCVSRRSVYAPERSYVATHACQVEEEKALQQKPSWSEMQGEVVNDPFVYTKWKCDGVEGTINIGTDGTKGWRP